MSFALRVALRYFRAGGVQSALTVLGVGVGLTVFIFLSALIGGLQKGLIDRVVGSLSHVTIVPSDPAVRPLVGPAPGEPGGAIASIREEKVVDRDPRIGDWRPLVAAVEQEPGIVAVSPSVAGPGFAVRGNQIRPITFRGVLEERASGIVDIEAKLVDGRMDLSGQSCVIGVELARDLGVRVRDRVRVRSGKGREAILTVQGVFDVGISEINARSVYVSLTNAQRLLDLVGYVTSIETKLSDVFTANEVADRLAASTGLQVESWMRQNREFLSGLQAQSGSSTMIKVFVMVAVAFGVASVLIVAVVQKQREIGILKSMGARTRSILLIFLMQGFLVGALGSVVGCTMGSLLVWGITLIPGDNATAPGRLFPAELEVVYLVQAVAAALVVGTLAGLAPARRAARMDPMEVIRYG